MHRGVRGGRGHHLGGEGRGARGGRLDLAPLDRATVAREARGRDGGYRGDGDGEAEAIESIATSRSSRRKRSAAVGGGASSSIPLRLELHERIGDEKSATDCDRLGKQTGGDVVHAEIVLSEYIRPICLQDEARGPSSYGKIQVIRWSEQRNLTFAPTTLVLDGGKERRVPSSLCERATRLCRGRVLCTGEGNRAPENRAVRLW